MLAAYAAACCCDEKARFLGGAPLAAFAACSHEKDADQDEESSFLGREFHEIVSVHDMQQSFLKERIGRKLPLINAATEPLSALVREMYSIIRDSLFSIVSTDFGSGNLVLLGGILVNLPPPYEDHFEPLCFQVLSRDEPVGTDLLAGFKFEQHSKVAGSHGRKSYLSLIHI